MFFGLYRTDIHTRSGQLLRTIYLVRLEALALHAVLPEGQDAVLKAHCGRRRVRGQRSEIKRSLKLNPTPQPRTKCPKRELTKPFNRGGKQPCCSLLSLTVPYRNEQSLISSILPTDPMQKSKLSSDASFLLDFSLPWRFTIFRFSAEVRNSERVRQT